MKEQGDKSVPVSRSAESLEQQNKALSKDLTKTVFSPDSKLKTNFLIERALKSSRTKSTSNRNILDNSVNPNDSSDFKDHPKFRKDKGKLKLKNCRSSDKEDGSLIENTNSRINPQKIHTEQSLLEANSVSLVGNSGTGFGAHIVPGTSDNNNEKPTSNQFPKNVERRPSCDGDQDFISKPETSQGSDTETVSATFNSGSLSSCAICSCRVPKTQVEEHQRSCLREKFAKQPDAKSLPDSKREMSCEICNKDISYFNLKAQNEHINKCLDKAETENLEENRYKELLAQARDAVLPCPLCGQNFKSQQSRKGHLKKCTKDKGMTVDQLKVLMKQQEETYAAQVDAGILPEEFRRKKIREQTAATDTRKNKSKKGEISNPLLTVSKDEARQRIFNRVENSIITKKASRLASSVQLPSSTSHSAVDSGDSSVAGGDNENSFWFKTSFSSLPSSSSELDMGNNSYSNLTTEEKSLMAEKQSRLEYYVKQLMPCVVPCHVPTGSKMKRVSTIPGRRKSDNTFRNSWNTEPSEFSTEVSSPSSQRSSSADSEVCESQTVQDLAELAMESADTTGAVADTGDGSEGRNDTTSLPSAQNRHHVKDEDRHFSDSSKENGVMDYIKLCVSSPEGDRIDLSEYNEQVVLSLLAFLYGGGTEQVWQIPEYWEQVRNLAQRFSLDRLLQEMSAPGTFTQIKLENSESDGRFYQVRQILPDTGESNVVLKKKGDRHGENALSGAGESSTDDARMQRDSEQKVAETDSQKEMMEVLDEYMSALEKQKALRSGKKVEKVKQLTSDINDMADGGEMSSLQIEVPVGVSDSLLVLKHQNKCEQDSVQDSSTSSTNERSCHSLSVVNNSTESSLSDKVPAFNAINFTEPSLSDTVSDSVANNRTKSSMIDTVPSINANNVTELYKCIGVTAPDPNTNNLTKLSMNSTVPNPNNSSLTKPSDDTLPALNANNPTESSIDDQVPALNPNNPTESSMSDKVPGLNANNPTESSMNDPALVPNSSNVKKPLPKRKNKTVTLKDFKKAVKEVSTCQNNDTEINDEAFTKIAVKIEKTMHGSTSPVFIPSVLADEAVSSDELSITSAFIATPNKKKRNRTPKKDAAALLRANSEKQSGLGGNVCPTVIPQSTQLWEENKSSIKLAQSSPQKTSQLDSKTKTENNRRSLTTLPAASSGFCASVNSLSNPVGSSGLASASSLSPTKSTKIDEYVSDEDLFADDDSISTCQERSFECKPIHTSSQAGCSGSAFVLNTEVDEVKSNMVFQSQPINFVSNVDKYTSLKDSAQRRSDRIRLNSSFALQSQPIKAESFDPHSSSTNMGISNEPVSPPLSQTSKTRRGLCNKSSPFFKLRFKTENSENIKDEPDDLTAAEVLHDNLDFRDGCPSEPTNLEKKEVKDPSLSSHSSASTSHCRIDPSHPSRRKLDLNVATLTELNKLNPSLQKKELEKSPLPLRERLQVKIPFRYQPSAQTDHKTGGVIDHSQKSKEKSMESGDQAEKERKTCSSIQINSLAQTNQSEQLKKNVSLVHLAVTVPQTVEKKSWGGDHNLQAGPSIVAVNNAPDTENCTSPGADADGDDSFMDIMKELEKCDKDLEEASTPEHSNISKSKGKGRPEWKEPSPFTPMAPYDSMNTPALKKAVEKIGVKPLGKKRMRELLKSVYHETHQYETDSDYETTPVKRLKVDNMSCPEPHAFANGHVGLPSTSSSSDVRNEDQDIEKAENDDLPNTQDSSGSDVPDLPEESILQGWPEEEEEAAATQMTQTSEEKMTDKLIQFVLSNHDIYEEILMYKPLELDVLKKRISDAGIRVSMPKVMDFLDERCITFTMKNMSSRNNRNQKGFKKKDNQIGKNFDSNH
ncbi:structure-specific endonuclease subunit SLX4 [Elysia marginata]|uniref:Structure-specific endonuclease subunit SLX4 n=1 Tax=Elysia marginata TaxID=1093978 RepID=A0AAV4FG22_9GAST|nr:structure-specific endonuclease subunit SLX4 [Elysia marginata]